MGTKDVATKHVLTVREADRLAKEILDRSVPDGLGRKKKFSHSEEARAAIGAAVSEKCRLKREQKELAAKSPGLPGPGYHWRDPEPLRPPVARNSLPQPSTSIQETEVVEAINNSTPWKEQSAEAKLNHSNAAKQRWVVWHEKKEAASLVEAAAVQTPALESYDPDRKEQERSSALKYIRTLRDEELYLFLLDLQTGDKTVEQLCQGRLSELRGRLEHISRQRVLLQHQEDELAFAEMEIEKQLEQIY